jgi:choline kinase
MTRAVFLAAGQGTRLRPLTNDKPKCLVELAGKSLLSRQIEVLDAAGITDIQIATSYREDQIRSLGYSTAYNPDYEHTNMVESLFSARPFLERCGDLTIAYGDIVYRPENLAALLACEDEIALMIDLQRPSLWSLRLDNPLDDAGTLVMDSRGFVTELGKKPKDYENIQGQYTGLIKIRGDRVTHFIAFFDALDREQFYNGKYFDNMYVTSFLQPLIDAGWNARAVTVQIGWLEIDSVDDLQRYEEMNKNGLLARFYEIND